MLEPLAVADECVAIGEAGFDLYYEYSPRAEQETAFRWQIRLAKRVDKAAGHPFPRRVGRHVPRARRRRSTATARSSIASPAVPTKHVPRLDRDCYLSFSGIVSFKNADDVRAAAALAPDDRLLRRDRLAVPHARAVPRQAERTGVRAARRRGAGAGARRGRRGDRRADARQRGARVRRRVGDPDGYPGPRPARAARACARRRRSASTSSPTPTPRVASCGSRRPSRATRVVEVGPGIGSLTVALADAGAHGARRRARPAPAARCCERSSRDAPWRSCRPTRSRSTGARCSTANGRWWRTCPTTSRRRWCSARWSPRR